MDSPIVEHSTNYMHVQIYRPTEFKYVAYTNRVCTCWLFVSEVKLID